MQTKIESFIESLANVSFGYTIAVISQLVIFPWFGIDITMGDNLLIGAYFTVISVVRSYLLRRYFNAPKP